MKKVAVALFLSVFVTMPAVAGNTYLGVTVGKNQITAEAGDTPVGSSTGYGILAGYSFGENVAAEAAYYKLGDAAFEGPGVTPELSGDLMSLSAVGLLPLGKDFSLLAKLGYASSSILVLGYSGRNSDLIYGVGAQYSINEKVSVRINYDMFKVGGDVFSTIDSTLMSVTAVFRM
jgi:opacity protein-like surface antigen